MEANALIQMTASPIEEEYLKRSAAASAWAGRR
jgi:hypothetical protein